MTLAQHLSIYHSRLSVKDLEPTATPGYWRVRGGCPGGANCIHAFRGALGACEGSTPLTISYAEWGARDARGRYVDPYREWKQARRIAHEQAGPHTT